MLAYAVSISLLSMPVANASAPTSEDLPVAATTLDEIEVVGVRQRLEQSGRLSPAIEKTEVISAEQIERKQAGSLAQAIEFEPGIRVNNECSMCGIKRVLINGMKGEHTTILVDGVPMHSVVSSYYGIDTITSAGIGSVEIARGPGAALATPEAIGGAINIISERATRNSLRGDLSTGEQGYRKGSVVGTLINESGSAWATIAGQYDEISREDSDGNGVSESPGLGNRSLTVKTSWDIGINDNIDARVAAYRSGVLGGPFRASKSQIFDSVNDGVSTPRQLFEDGDVRKPFAGFPYETAEVIDTTREEYTLRWTHVFNRDVNAQITGSFIDHGQDSLYEGFDYRNDDEVSWFDSKLNIGLGTQHLLSVGASRHAETMRSQSDALAAIQALDPTVYGDSFDYLSQGIYAQDVWSVSDALELSLAARLDKISVDYIEQPGGKEIDRTVLSPRALLKWSHTDAWTSRFSGGRGYRAPLSFFESDHGLLDDGYEVQVNDLETAWQIGYSLGYETDASAVTASANFSEVENLAFIDNSGPRPVLRNLADKQRIDTYDISASQMITEHFTLGGSLEYFDYADSYKPTFSSAPVEERARLFADWNGHGWQAYASINWTGARNLLEYGAGDRFNVFDDVNDDGIVDAGELRDPKRTHAPSYFTIDARIEKALGRGLSVYAGGNNLTDYTQAGDEETPLFWDADGGYDVVHIYGPLRGRVLYAGIKAKF